MDTAVRDSILVVDEQTWLIGGQLLLSCERASCSAPEKIPGDGAALCFSFREVDTPPPSSATETQPFPLVYDVGDAHAVWKIGKSYLRVMKLISPYIARQHDILNAMHRIVSSLDVRLPKVLYHGEWDGRYYLITSEVPGQTLEEAWPRMEESMKARCVERISQFCIALSKNEGSQIEALSGGHLAEYYLALSTQDPDDCFSPQKLLRICEDAGMDCSTLHLYHCDLGPGNIIVDLEEGALGVIDFECVGYVPKAWIRTKFRVSGGHDLDNIPLGDGGRHEWRVRVQRELGKEGFPEVADSWMRLMRRGNA